MNTSDMAIKVEKISKCYRIGLKEKLYDNFGSAIFNFIKSPLNNYRKYRSLYQFDENSLNYDDSLKNSPSDIIWALRDVSFQVEQGEVLGIIGSNGAGKSTLLKILSRITDPTSGLAKIRGRVSSLIEVGTGFHPELTGRENVYLNGTVLGMTKKEVDRKFDEIVDFSGIKKFIDTPVKRYSSGMKLRLAFAVAAHLEPEILLVDEVLAVGDATFQKKCMGKMGAVARAGRTVLLVSHNMAAITELCERALWLENGRIKQSGPAARLVSSYLSNGTEGQCVWHNSAPFGADNEVQIRSVRLLSHDNQPTSIVAFESSFKVEIRYDVREPIRDLYVNYTIANSQGILVFESMDTDMLPEWKGSIREAGQYLAVCRVPERLLMPGAYLISVAAFIANVKIIQRHEGVLTFDVSEVGYSLNRGRAGVVTPMFEWEVTRTGGIETPTVTNEIRT